MAIQIIGNDLTNLLPDGPDYQHIERRQYLIGISDGVRVVERFVIAQSAGLTSVPSFGTAHATETTCLLHAIHERTDDTGALYGVTLEYWNPAWDAGSIGIGDGETLYELDQSLVQVPVERSAYYASLSPQDIADVNTALQSWFFSGNSELGGTRGFTGTVGDSSFHCSLEYQTGDGTWVGVSWAQLKSELLYDKLRGMNDVLRPSLVFRKTTTSQTPVWTDITASAGLRMITPITIVSGSTADNWLFVPSRAERRRNNGMLFHSISSEWLYNPDGWDKRHYAAA